MGRLLQIMVLVVPVGLMHVSVVGLDLCEGRIICREEPLHESQPRNSVPLEGDDQSHSDKGPIEKRPGTRWVFHQIFRQQIQKQHCHHESRCDRNEHLKTIHVHMSSGTSHDPHSEQDHGKRDRKRGQQQDHEPSLPHLTVPLNDDKLERMETTPRILFENEGFVALDKPPGWLSVPARHPSPSDRVVSLWLRESAVGSAYMIHRLDRFTSGVMLVAKTPDAHRTGCAWFQDRMAKKIYHFLASPPPSRPAIQIRTPVEGKPAQTLFEVMESTPTHFLGKATPLTGRFHQIREHAAQAGFPLLGDRSFGGKPSERVCLHAHSLETPVGRFEAPLAPDLAGLWESLKHA